MDGTDKVKVQVCWKQVLLIISTTQLVLMQKAMGLHPNLDDPTVPGLGMPAPPSGSVPAGPPGVPGTGVGGVGGAVRGDDKQSTLSR